MPSATPFAIVRRIFGWFVLCVLIVTLVLILKKSPAPAVSVSPAAAASAERKLDAAAQAASSGQPAQVRLDSTELNSYLAQNLQLAGAGGSGSLSATSAPGNAQSADPAANAPAIAGGDPQTVAQAASNVKAVTIDLDSNLVKTYVIFNVHGADLSLEIDGRLYTRDGYLKFDPVGGKIGSFPLPQSALQDAVQKMMDSPENREKLRLPADVSNIEVQDGQVLISYK